MKKRFTFTKNYSIIRDVKSQTVGLIKFIFGGTAIIENIQENANEYVNMVEYFFNNIGIVSAITISISLIIFIFSVLIQRM